MSFTATSLWDSTGQPYSLLVLGGLLASSAGLSLVVYAGLRMLTAGSGFTKGNWPGFKRFAASTSESRTKKAKGDARFAPLWIMVSCSVLMVAVPVTIAVAKYMNRFPIYELRGVQVISQVPTADPARPGYTYWMEYQSESVGRLNFVARFCPDYKPPFDPGDYLNVLRYEDRHDCWSIKNEYAGVVMRRDARGRTDSERTRQTTEIKAQTAK